MADRLKGLEEDSPALDEAPTSARSRFFRRAKEKIKDPLKAKMGTLMNRIKSASTRDRVRFESDDFNLDLCYITDRIIAMAAPKKGVQSVLGNDIKDVSRFLEEKHSGHYMIWNLSGPTYDYELLGNQVLEFLIPPHCPPALERLFQICDSIDSWLRADPENVAAVHCADGRGRTGVVVSCYLRYARFFETGQEALFHFASKRSLKEIGVRMPSQKRYVLYFCDVLSGHRSSTNPVPIGLRRVVMHPVPAFGAKGSCRPYMQIFQDGKEVYNSATGATRLQKYASTDGSVLMELDVLMRGDIMIVFTHVGIKRRVTMCRFCFHTAFVPNGVLRLTKRQLDGRRALKEKYFSDDFFMDLIFDHEDLGPAPSDATAWDVMRLKNQDGAVISSGAAFVNLAEAEAENEWKLPDPPTNVPSPRDRTRSSEAPSPVGGGGRGSPSVSVGADAGAAATAPGASSSAAAAPKTSSSAAASGHRDRVSSRSRQRTTNRRGTLSSSDTDNDSLGSFDDEALAGIELSSSDEDSDSIGESFRRKISQEKKEQGEASGNAGDAGSRGEPPADPEAKDEGGAASSPSRTPAAADVDGGASTSPSRATGPVDPALAAIDLLATPVGTKHASMSAAGASSADVDQGAASTKEGGAGSGGASPSKAGSSPTSAPLHRRVMSDTTGLINLDDAFGDASSAPAADEPAAAATADPEPSVDDLLGIMAFNSGPSDDSRADSAGTTEGASAAVGASVVDLLGFDDGDDDDDDDDDDVNDEEEEQEQEGNDRGDGDNSNDNDGNHADGQGHGADGNGRATDDDKAGRNHVVPAEGAAPPVDDLIDIGIAESSTATDEGTQEGARIVGSLDDIFGAAPKTAAGAKVVGTVQDAFDMVSEDLDDDK